MSVEIKKEKERVDLVINPDYLQELKLIQATTQYETLNRFLQDVLSGKSLLRDNARKLESKINQHLNTCITQGINNFQTLEDKAMSGTVPMAYKELEDLRVRLQKGHTSECLDTFVLQTTVLREKISSLIEASRYSGIDESKQALNLKSNLADIDIHTNLPGSKCNLCLRLDAETYAKYFIKNKNKSDPYNRRAFKRAIEKNVEFTINTLNPSAYEFIMSQLTILDDFNHKMNEAIIKGQATGFTELMKVFVETKTRVTKRLEAEVKNGNRS